MSDSSYSGGRIKRIDQIKWYRGEAMITGVNSGGYKDFMPLDELRGDEIHLLKDFITDTLVTEIKRERHEAKHASHHAVHNAS